MDKQTYTILRKLRKGPLSREQIEKMTGLQYRQYEKLLNTKGLAQQKIEKNEDKPGLFVGDWIITRAGNEAFEKSRTDKFRFWASLILSIIAIIISLFALLSSCNQSG